MTAAPDPTPRERAETFFETYAADLAATTGPIKVHDAAIRAARELAAADPDAWQDFVDTVTGEVIADRLRSTLARHRHAALHATKGSVFRKLVGETIEAVGSGASPFDIRYAIPTRDNLRPRLGDMTRLDLLAVAKHRSQLARTNGIEAIFLKAIADRLPDDTTTVAEAMTEDDIITLHTKAEGSDLGDIPDTTDPEPEEVPANDE